jgi:hypothetical protein
VLGKRLGVLSSPFRRHLLTLIHTPCVEDIIFRVGLFTYLIKGTLSPTIPHVPLT